MSTDNSDLEGKLAVRRAALATLKGEPPIVLDCFAGEGHMYEAVWHKAAEYLGLEKRFARPAGHPRGQAWRGDNRDLIARAIRRRPWNVIDLDAYGTPWSLFKYVAQYAESPRLVVTTTCGLSRSLCSTTSAPHWLRELAGFRGLSYTGLMVRWYDDLMRWTIAHCLSRSSYRITRCRRTLSRANKDTWYWLLEMERPTAGAAGDALANEPPTA